MHPPINWPALHSEALDLLVGYLQVDTSNPPGNEAEAARFLAGILEAEGIPFEVIPILPGRDALVARLEGDGSKRPLMLCNHTDVVPVEQAQWTMPAFEGVVREGRLYGRGAVDMKGCGVMQLIAFVLFRRLGIPLKRDLVFLAVPDEEAGSVYGMEWLCKHRPDVVDVEFELSEGGGGITQWSGQPIRLFNIATNEKDICWMRLTAVGTPGHGSRPHEDNSAVRLARALVRLSEWQRGLTFTPETTAFLERMVAAGRFPSLDQADLVESTILAQPELHAMFVNTLNLTMIDSGIRPNVIPAKSEAVIDCRLLPGQLRDDWREQVIAAIDDPRVSVDYYLPPQDQPEAVPWDTELFQVIQSVVTEAFEDALVVPGMTVGGTDNRFLRARGIPAYGFIPCLLSPEERAGFHGNDEFLTIDNLNMGCELMFEIVYRMCT